MERAYLELSKLSQRFVFVGGATVSLHIDDDSSRPVRVTKDVDFVVEVAGYAEYAVLEEQLRAIGFEQKLDEEESPICRWEKEGLLIDVLPTKPEILGFGRSRWFVEGFYSACRFQLSAEITVEAFGPIYLLAAKIEAFEDRGKGDWLLSQDIEDIVTILDGRTVIFEELSVDDHEATVFVREWLLQHGNSLVDPFAGHVGDYGRALYLVEKIRLLGR